jgi:hypothetical protein
VKVGRDVRQGFFIKKSYYCDKVTAGVEAESESLLFPAILLP